MNGVNGKYEISKKKLLSVGLALVILVAGIGAGVTIVLSGGGEPFEGGELSGGGEPKPVLVDKGIEHVHTNEDPYHEQVTIHFTVRNDGATGRIDISVVLWASNGEKYTSPTYLDLKSGETKSWYLNFCIPENAHAVDFKITFP